MNMNKGKYTEQIVRSILQNANTLLGGFPVIRLFDTFSARGFTLPDRPCDFIVILPNSRAVLIEVKETKHEKGLLFSAIRPAQFQAMQIAYGMSLPYYLIVRAYKQKVYYVIPAGAIINEKIAIDFKLMQKQQGLIKDRVIKSYVSWDKLTKYKVSYKNLSNYIIELLREEANYETHNP